MEKTNKIQLSTALKLGGALMGTCIGSGFATGSECLSFFITYGIKGAIGALIISFVIYFLFTRELFNKGQELSEERAHRCSPIISAKRSARYSTGSAPSSSAAAI